MQFTPIAALGRRGFITFATQDAAEAYLIALPRPYSGRTTTTPTGWAVSYRFTEESCNSH